MASERGKFTREQLLGRAREMGYLNVPCPQCDAGVGEACATNDGWPHGKRIALQRGKSPRSVRAIPTAFETNRRRH